MSVRPTRPNHSSINPVTLLVQALSLSTSRVGDAEIKKFVIDQRKGTSGIFRDDPWFARVEANRKVDFSKNPFTVVLSDGSPSVKGLGLVVPSPELRSVSVAGKIDTEGMTGKLKNAVGERRLLAWTIDSEDSVIFVMSNDDDLAAALVRKRETQEYHQAKYVLDDWVTPALWESMTGVALDLMAEDDSICEWWRLNASILGDNAPWNKLVRGQRNKQRRPNLDGGAAATPSGSSVNAAPLPKSKIEAIHNRFSRTALNAAYFMDVEPSRFDIGDNVLYAKRTPWIPDGEALPTCRMPDFARDTKNIPKALRRDIANVIDYFVGCFAVISLDGESYFQATEEEVREDMRVKGIDVEFCRVLNLPSLPEKTYQRVVNEKLRRLDIRNKKRKASSADAAREGAPKAKAPKSSTEDNDGESEGEDDSGEMDAQELREVIHAKFGHLIGSIPVFDVTDSDHAPVAEIVRFGQFRKFTATTSQDIGNTLSGRKGGFQEEPFPMTTAFGKQGPSSPDITDVKRLYNLGLMKGSTSNNILMCANASKISQALGQEGLENLTVERYLEEVQHLMDEDGDTDMDEDGDTDVVVEDSGYTSAANSGVV